MNKVKAVLFECPKQFDIVYFKFAIRWDPETISKEKKRGEIVPWGALLALSGWKLTIGVGLERYRFQGPTLKMSR